MTDLGHRPVAVVGHAVGDDRRPAGGRTLRSGSPRGCRGRHHRSPAGWPGRSCPWGRCRRGPCRSPGAARELPSVLAPAEPGGDRDLSNEAREQLAPLGVLGALAVLDVGPLAVSRHGARFESVGGPRARRASPPARAAGAEKAEYHRSKDPSTPGRRMLPARGGKRRWRARRRGGSAARPAGRRRRTRRKR